MKDLQAKGNLFVIACSNYISADADVFNIFMNALGFAKEYR